ncbi:hypothetical protein KEM48_014633 [Puccinia striiformis f. sp. tritici PST-130]|nr:hypothetical protein KEM48_014633 [Puccinia striiformis f. sp. tritici PST-130]
MALERPCLYSAVGGIVGRPSLAAVGPGKPRRVDGAAVCVEGQVARPPGAAVVQILVVVANTREGPSGAAVEKGSCEQPLSKSQSILSPGEILVPRAKAFSNRPWGERNPVRIPEPDAEPLPSVRGSLSRPGDRNELEEAAGGSGKSSLFSVSVVRPWNPLAGDRDASAKSTARCGGVRDPHATLKIERGPRGVFASVRTDIRSRSPRIGSEERGGSGSGRRRSVGGAGDTPAVARAPGLRTGSLEAVAGSSPSADRGTTELRSLAAARPAVRPGVGSPSPAVRPPRRRPRSRIDRHVTVNSELARTRGIRLSN